MLIGIVGKPSSGKSTILNALCLTDAKMGSYPFTTIKPNRGVALVRVPCPCQDLEQDCNPRTGRCVNGTRLVPVELLDVAGLVPGASTGKGMGNKFLDDLRQAHALIHVVDASGTTDEEGNTTEDYDPSQDIDWLNKELDAWIYRILFSQWDRVSKRLEQNPTKLIELINERLSGLGTDTQKVKKAIANAGLNGVNGRLWDEEQKEILAHELRELTFPMAIAANKMDKPNADANIDKMKRAHPEMKIIPTSGLSELTLRKAEEEGLISYELGSSSFSFDIEDPESSKKFKVLDAIQTRLLDVKGTTGVTELLEYAVFELLNLIPVFPVEDQTHLTDQDGRILPDVFLVPNGTPAKKFAGHIHSDLENHFIHAVLVTDNNKRVSADHPLKFGDVVKIVSSA